MGGLSRIITIIVNHPQQRLSKLGIRLGHMTMAVGESHGTQIVLEILLTSSNCKPLPPNVKHLRRNYGVLGNLHGDHLMGCLTLG